jgi:hypothetical protein
MSSPVHFQYYPEFYRRISRLYLEKGNRDSSSAKGIKSKGKEREESAR